MNSESIILDLPAQPAVAARTRASDFYELTKPRMNFLVVITTMVGFCLASRGIDWIRLLHTLIGTFLTASAASALNQLIERRFDALMPRTRNRPLPCSRIAPSEALFFGIASGIVGVSYLAILVNPL